MTADNNVRLHVYLLGDLRLVYGDDPVVTLNSPRAQSLLAYLILHAGEPQSRRHLAFLLWPDSSDEQSRSNLRKLWHDLRRFLPQVDHFVQAQGPSLVWQCESPYTLDVAEMERAVEQAATAAELEHAVSLYRGPLLQSCYDDWVLSERERLHQLFVDALARLVDQFENQGDYRAAIKYAQLLLQHDPLHEDVYRSLMRLYALTDDRAAALHTFRTCALVLKRELDVEPSPVTRQAYERLLKMEKAPVAPATASLALVGRGAEWMRLQTAWRNAAKGPPQWVVLTGAPGIGKTRLTEELVHWAGKQGIASATARCYAAESGLGFGPVTAWLRARALPALEGVWLTELTRLLPELGSAHPELGKPGPLAEPWQRLRFFEALARAVLGNPPLILVLDDIPFCDRDSLEWLNYALRYNGQGALLVVSTLCLEDVGADHPLNGMLASWRRTHQLTEIAVQPLNEEESRQLASSVEGREWEPREGEALYRETEGNPLFIVETLRAGRPAEGGVPRTIQAVIGARLAQLSPEARALANVAAVIGRRFTVPVLANASGVGEEELARGLGELRRQRLVRAPVEDGYDFDHSKIREVVYGELNPAERQRLHRRVAEAMETAAAGQGNGKSGEIAEHLEEAGLGERAVPYEIHAGDAARRMYAHETALAHYRRAMPRVSAGEQIELRLRVGKVLEWVGRWEEAEGEYRQGLALAEQAGAEGAQAECEMALGELFHRKGLDDQALLWLRRALARFEKAGNQAGIGRVQGTLGLIHELLGDYARALEYHQSSLAIAHQLEDRYGVARETGSLGLVYWKHGEHKRALSHYQQQYDLSNALGDRLGMSRAMGRMGLVFREQGDHARAISSFEQRLLMSEDIGDRLGMSYAIGQLGVVYFEQGDYGRALDHWTRQLKMAEELGALRGISQGLRHIGMLYLERGEYDRAKTMLAHSLDIALRVGDRRIISHAEGNIADLYAAQGLGEAESHYARATTLLRGLNIPYTLCEYLSKCACYHAERGQYDKAAEDNGQAKELAEALGRKSVQFETTVLANQLCLARGEIKPARAAKALEKLLEIWPADQEQAELYYQLWRIDPQQEEWRKTAARHYRRLHGKVQRAKFRERYAQLAGSRLTPPDPLPELPEMASFASVNWESLMARVDQLVAQYETPGNTGVA